MHFLLLRLLLLMFFPLANAGKPLVQDCSNTGNYTANSTYQDNLHAISITLLNNTLTSHNLFATATIGSVPDQISALALCRGDTDATSCLHCLTTAFHDAQNLCPYVKDVTMYYDLCNLRYSNLQFLTNTGDNSVEEEISPENATNVTASVAVQFSGVVTALTNALAKFAAYNYTKVKFFAVGEDGSFDLSGIERLYGLAQCVPTLTAKQCEQCLVMVVSETARIFTQLQAGGTIGLWCTVRYDTSPFYNGSAMLSMSTPVPPAMPPPALVVSPPAPTQKGGSSDATVLALSIALPLAAALVAVTLICFCFCKGRRPPPTNKAYIPYAPHPEDHQSVKSLLLNLSTLRAATTDFAESNKLGEGGFGAVYKGILPNGDEIAVKRLSKSSKQGLQELKNELVLVAKLQHKNLVRLIGACLEEQEKLIVYEYIPNRSLDTFLFDTEKCKQLDWTTRYKIINGVARGLQYLHEDSQLRIIHRDMKATNVLLDADMNPKIADFGFARLFGVDQTQEVTRRVVGTYGYMAPEYAMRGHFSIKSDIFSFGVIVLEIVTGRRNSGSSNMDEPDLLTSTWEYWSRGAIGEIIDPNISNNCPSNEVWRCIHMGLLCVQENPADRPRMSSIAVMLNSKTVSLEAPSRPAFAITKSASNSDMHSNVNGGIRHRSMNSTAFMSPNEVSITELQPR